MLEYILNKILTNKLTTFLCIFIFSLLIAVIAVAVEKNNYRDNLKTCEYQLSQTTTTTTTTTETPLIPPINYRLSPNIQPLHYKITLTPNIKSGIFDGAEDITISVDSSLKDIVLHSSNMTIIEDSVTLTSGHETFAIELLQKFDDKTEFYLIRTKQTLPKGIYSLKMSFKGSLDGQVGFYKSTYKDGMIATSKFEPTYARQAFPCFDEPAMKANFSIELIAPKDYIALSNMDEESNTIKDDGRIIKFKESVKMSTYLVCFIVCDFKYKEKTIDAGGIGDDFKFKVYASKEQLEKVEFSLNFGKNVTEFFIGYFRIAYPLPKLDMIAIPDFVSGAMEHWGLVTFRETNLLYDEKTTSIENMQNIARVVAHEISHMWFGNLVTMKWWNDLWLNEGFASYMQYKAVHAIFPDWQMLDQFLISNTHSILALDSTLNSHPIVQKVETPDEITAIFDSVTYNKGAAIIRMLEGFVGEEIFREGVTSYLNKHAFGNTVTQDLLDELTNFFPTPNLTHIMDTWTRQTGFPVVTVTHVTDKEYKLTQRIFLIDPDNVPTQSEFKNKWFIPITYKIRGQDTVKLLWFPDDEEFVNIKLEEGEKLLKVNSDQVGYYRVNYSPEMWQQIKSELSSKSTELTVSDRAHILNDVFNLAQAGEVQYDLALDMSQYLTEEIEYIPWYVAYEIFSKLKPLMSESTAYIEYRVFLRNLLQNVLKVKNPEKDHVKSLLINVVYKFACSVGDTESLKDARVRFSDYIKNNETIEPNSKNAVYFYGIQETGEEEWSELWNRFMEEDDAQEKTNLMRALAASRDPSILNRYLSLAWNEDYVRSQDHLNIVQYVSANPVGTPLVWDHFRGDWPRFVDKFTLNSRVLGNAVIGITRNFATALKLKEMEAFFKEYPEAGAGERARKQAKENVQNNINWMTKHEPAVRAWLNSNKNN